MKLKSIVTLLAIAVLPVCAQAQPAAGKPTKADAQKVVQIVSADKAKAKSYCDIVALGEQMDAAAQKKDEKKLDELSQKADELSAKVGPEYVALMNGLENIDPNSKEGEEFGAILEGLDKLCAK